MRIGAYVYPWDVDGDPAAAERIAGLGVREVVLAAAYHAVRAVTPFHPGHRIVTRDAAVYYRPGPGRWAGSPLRPAEPDSPAPCDGPAGRPELAGSFERAAERLRAAGLTVSAWVVVAHNDRLAAAHPDYAVRNAYGDTYPWALCVASPQVARYAATLAAEIAALGCAGGVELEACGWYGFGHLSAHDKTGGRPPGGTPGWLLDVCFCASCCAAFREAGIDPGGLARSVRAALDEGFAREGGRPREPAPGLPAELGEALAAVRSAVAGRFLDGVLTAVREAAPGTPALVHSHPDPRQAGANPGYDPAVLLGPGGADGIVLSCPGPAEASAGLVAKTAAAVPRAAGAPQGSGQPGSGPRPGGGGAGEPRVAATLTGVTALGARTSELPAQARAVLAAGATELRLYHAGLASPADLAAMRDMVTAVRRDRLR